MANAKNITQLVHDLIETTVKDLGYFIWDVEYNKIGADYNLTITIDKKSGININDCEIVHKAIDPLLDVADIIENQYILNVSSPGIERNIRTKEHYKLCKGQTIKVKFFSPFENKKTLIGILSDIDIDNDMVILIKDDGKEVTIPKKQIARANVYFK